MKQLLLLSTLSVFLAAACSASSGMAEDLELTNVWGRSSPMVAANGAFYLTIKNNTESEERLLSASSEICTVAELHEMYMKEDDVMGMRPVPDGYISIPPGETVELKVGGLHVMCIDKKLAFEVGEKIPLTLEFANAGEMYVTAEIRD